MRIVTPKCIWYHVAKALSENRWSVNFNGMFHATVKRRGGFQDATFGYRHTNQWKTCKAYWNYKTQEIRIK